MINRVRQKFRPPICQVFESPVHLAAFGGGVGLSPVAPGTFGTLAAIPFWFLLSWLSLEAYAISVSILFLLGCWVCGRSAKLIGVSDYRGIVFDEMIGFLVTATPLLDVLHWRSGPLWAWLLVAFILFRIFDIAKPPPIGWFDRNVHGGLGIMLDDTIAAVPAGALLAIALRVFH